MPLSVSGDENAFTKILTTAPNDMQKGVKRQQSWLEKRVRTFSGDGTIPCPSCRGSGVKEASTDLVALIPYNDERLRPRYTKCKILLALIVCAVIIGVSVYIFLPGKVIVKTTNITIVNASIASPRNYLAMFDLHGGRTDENDRSNMTWKVDVTVENRNRYLSITVNELKVDLKWNVNDLVELGYLVHGNFTIRGHEHYTSSYIINTPQRPKYDPDKTHGYNDNLLNCKCCRSWNHGCGNLHMISDITLHYTLHVGRFNYFSGFVNGRNYGYDNCKYTDNIGIKNITCETYETCHKGIGLEEEFL